MLEVHDNQQYRTAYNQQLGARVWIDLSSGDMYLAPGQQTPTPFQSTLETLTQINLEFLCPCESMPLWEKHMEEIAPNLEEFHPNHDDFIGEAPQCPHCNQYVCSSVCHSME